MPSDSDLLRAVVDAKQRLQVDAYAEGYKAGRIAALREVGHTDPTCGLFRVDGNEHQCSRCRLLAEAESGEQVREVGDDR